MLGSTCCNAADRSCRLMSRCWQPFETVWGRSDFSCSGVRRQFAISFVSPRLSLRARSDSLVGCRLNLRVKLSLLEQKLVFRLSHIHLHTESHNHHTMGCSAVWLHIHKSLWFLQWVRSDFSVTAAPPTALMQEEEEEYVSLWVMEQKWRLNTTKTFFSPQEPVVVSGVAPL